MVEYESLAGAKLDELEIEGVQEFHALLTRTSVKALVVRTSPDTWTVRRVGKDGELTFPMGTVEKRGDVFVPIFPGGQKQTPQLALAYALRSLVKEN